MTETVTWKRSGWRFGFWLHSLCLMLVLPVRGEDRYGPDGRSDPSGRTLLEWLERSGDTSLPDSERQQVTEVLKRIPPPPAEILVKMMSSDRSRVISYACHRLLELETPPPLVIDRCMDLVRNVSPTEIAHLQSMQGPHAFRLHTAFRLIRRGGTAALPIVAHLRALAEVTHRTAWTPLLATLALLSLDIPGRPEHLEAISRDVAAYRSVLLSQESNTLAAELHRVGVEPVPFLAKVVDHSSDLRNRLAALEELHFMANIEADLLVFRALRDPDPVFGEQAHRVFGRERRASKAAHPQYSSWAYAVLRGIEDNDEVLLDAAKWARQTAREPYRRLLVQALLEKLLSSTGLARMRIADLLAVFGPRAAEVVPALIAAVRADPDDEAAARALRGIRRLTTLDAEVLRQVAGDPDSPSALRRTAAMALTAASRYSPESWEALIEAASELTEATVSALWDVETSIQLNMYEQDSHDSERRNNDQAQSIVRDLRERAARRLQRVYSEPSLRRSLSHLSILQPLPGTILAEPGAGLQGWEIRRIRGLRERADAYGADLHRVLSAAKPELPAPDVWPDLLPSIASLLESHDATEAGYGMLTAAQLGPPGLSLLPAIRQACKAAPRFLLAPTLSAAGELGGEAIPVVQDVQNLIPDLDWGERIMVAATETLLGLATDLPESGSRDPIETVSHLLEGLRSPHVTMRRQAIFALRSLDTAEARSAAVRALMPHVGARQYAGYDELYIQNLAIWLLGELGVEAKSAVPALEELSRGQPSRPSLLAMLSLLKLAPERGDELVRRVCEYAVRINDRPGEWMTPRELPAGLGQIRRCARTGRPVPANVKTWTVNAMSPRFVRLCLPTTSFEQELKHLGEVIVRAAPGILAGHDFRNRREVVNYLGAVASPAAIELLIQCLLDEDDAIYREAAMALADIGPPALDALQKAAADQDEFRRYFARELLRKAPFADMPAAIAELEAVEQR